MRTAFPFAFVAVLACGIASGARAEPSAEIQALQQQIAQLTAQQQLLAVQLSILNTHNSILASQRVQSAESLQAGDLAQQTALVNAMSALQAAQNSLAKGGIDAEKALVEAQKSLVDAQNLLEAARLKSGFVGVDVLKTYFDKAGKEGSITIKDSGARVLRTSVASAEAASELAALLCTRLAKAGVSSAVVVDMTKIMLMQEAGLISETFDRITKGVVATKQSVDVYLDQAQIVPMVSPGIGVIAELPYIAGGISSVLKLFRSDRELVVGDAARAELVATLLATHPACLLKDARVVDIPFPEYLALNVKVPLEAFRLKYERLLANNAVATDTVARAESRTKEVQDRLKKKENDGGPTSGERKKLADDLEGLQRALGVLKGILETSKAFMDSLKPTSGERLMGYAILQAMETAIQGKPRLVFTVSSQDIQETKTSVWSGQKIFRAGTVHATYRVIGPDNTTLKTGGFVAYSTPETKIELGEKESVALPRD